MADDPLPRAPAPGFSDHTFQAPHGTTLSFRVWPADPAPSSPAPFITWTHGGGWAAGNHFGPLAWMDPGFRRRGYHLVSHNYRLAPQANLDDQLADCLAAIAWCRAELPRIVGTDRVDVDRYVICGESAGGLLVTLLAHHLPAPAPRAVIDVYGLTDWLAYRDFTNIPEGRGAPWEGEFTEDEFEALMADRDPAKQLMAAQFWDEHTHFDEAFLRAHWQAPDFTLSRRMRLQGEYHRWRSDTAARRDIADRTYVLGSMHPERFASPAALKEYILSVSPLVLLEGKSTYPPTAFLHGTGDTAVDVSQSRAMAGKLREMGVPVVECYEPGEPHVFDNKYKSPDVPGWDIYIQPIIDFCNHHVGHEVA